MHQVYSALNKPRTWFGVDTRVFMCAALAGMAILLCSKTKLGMALAFAAFLGIAGAGILAAKQDSQFLLLLPISVKLKSRYDAGKRR